MQRDRLILAEIVDAGERIISLVGERSAEQVDGDRDRRDALLWNFTVLGEAIGQLSGEVTAANPDVNWSDPVRLRNRIVHGYWTVDLSVLVAAARNDLPALLAAVRTIETPQE